MVTFPAERTVIRRQIENALASIASTFHPLRQPITGWQISIAGTQQDVSPPPRTGWVDYLPDSEWGGPDVTNWFRAKVTIPEEMEGYPVAAILNTGGEGLCHVNGQAVQGLDHNRWEVILRERAKAGEVLEILIEAYSGSSPKSFKPPSLVMRNELAWSLYWDLRVALEVVDEHPPESQVRVQLLELVDRSVKRIDLSRTGDLRTYNAALREAERLFRRDLRKFRHSHGSGGLTLVSHSHIDLAWTWRLRETRRKVGRTWATVLHYMDRYPEVIFIQSQPQLYEYVRDHYPGIWERVKERIREGRWEVTGPAWVEQDMNIPTGESHVRQYLYGSRFYKRELGVRGRLAWMPDTFGFPHSIPQILKKAQVDGFVTWKLAFGQYEGHPHSLFRWRGIDGTELPAISLPTLCAGDPSPHEVKRHWDAFRQKNLTDGFLHVFGHGDGGGGPTPEMFEYVRREDNIIGIPRCRFGSFQDEFDRLLKRVEWDRMPVFNDELYLELHRGCQTSQARTKRNNRKSELLARDAEILSSKAQLLGAPYPARRLEEAWKLILLNQFHDILPGSSIGEVYKDSEVDYARVRESLGEVRDSAISELSKAIDTRGPGRPIIIHNTLPWDRSGVAELALPGDGFDEVTILDSDGRPALKQLVQGPNGQDVMLFEVNGIPSMGHAVYHIVQVPTATEPYPSGLRATKRILESDFFKVSFNREGAIGRIYDKVNRREVLAPGAVGNELVLFEDRPAENDAWDIDFNYEDLSRTLTGVKSIQVIEEGPVRATLLMVRTTDASTIEQRISLWRSIPRIDFHTKVDWHEKHKLLKAAFPVDILARTATYEIQYGAIQRPTHRSNAIDQARFEVPAQRWIDLSEAGYGVSLLNDCKYGFDVHDNRMRISLLRAPTQPDPHADEGLHEFTYSLYPHAGTWQEAATVRRAYELNVPFLVQRAKSHTGSMPPVARFVSVDRPNVVVDWIKRAEDSDALVVRLYEAHGARGPVRLACQYPIASASECDLLEDGDRGLGVDGNALSFPIDPWEIKTLKVSLLASQG